MKELLLGLSLLAIPTVVSCGSYTCEENVDRRVEICAGEIRVTPQIPIVRDIAKFAMRDGKLNEREALEFGHSLSRTFAPKRLAAISSKEANFDKNAIGPDGHDKGAYQVREIYHGKVPKDIAGQTRQAEKILLDNFHKAKGNLDKATVKYNGAGRKARLYAQDVKRIERLI